MRLLHLAEDEKFIDQAMRVFETALPDGNHLYLYCKGKPKFVRSKPYLQFHRVRAMFGFSEKKVQTYDAIVLHSLRTEWFQTIRNSTDVPILWIGWGYDYYDLIYADSSKLYFNKTLQALNRISFTKKFKTTVDSLIRPGMKAKLRILKEIDYFSPVLDTEYDLVKRAVNQERFPKIVDWNYGTLEEDLTIGLDASVWSNGTNIIVGNSASPTNNHLEAFDALNRGKKYFEKIFCPLAYSGDPNYKDQIINTGKTLFGDKFQPLEEFIPIESYLKVLTGSNCLIINSIRQQGFGNIIVMLYLGAKVYLQPENPIYRYLSAKGATIFTVQNIIDDPKIIMDELTHDQKQHNRSITRALFAGERPLQRTTQLIHRITEYRSIISKTSDEI